MKSYIGIFSKKVRGILALILVLCLALTLPPVTSVLAVKENLKQTLIDGKTEPSTEVTEASAEVAKPSPEAAGPIAEVAKPSIEVTKPTAQESTAAEVSDPTTADQSMGEAVQQITDSDDAVLFTSSSGENNLSDGSRYEEAFTDKVFLEYVLNVLNKRTGGERTGASTISANDISEMAKITSLNMSGVEKSDSPDFVGIESLAGIGYFIGLKELNVSYNQLTSLDLSDNPALQELDASNNQIKTLIISNNRNLRILIIDYNQLTSLVLLNNAELIWLFASNNQFQVIDVSHNPNLQLLDLAGNKLTGLDITDNISLTKLWVYGNDMSSEEDVIGGSRLVIDDTLVFYPQQVVITPTSLDYDETRGIISWDAQDDYHVWYSVYVEGFDKLWLVDEGGSTKTFNIRDIIKSFDFYLNQQNDIIQRELSIQIVAAIGDKRYPAFSVKSEEIVEVSIPQLPDEPDISVDEDDGYTLSWKAIPNADEYIIYIRNTDSNKYNKKIIQSTVVGDYESYDLSDPEQKVGEYEVQIRAIASGEVFGISNLSNPAFFEQRGTQLDPPKTVEIKGTVLQWSAVTIADNSKKGYDIYIDGNYVEHVTDRSFNLNNLNPKLGVGSYQIQVRSCGDGKEYLHSVRSEPPVTFVVSDTIPDEGGNGTVAGGLDVDWGVISCKASITYGASKEEAFNNLPDKGETKDKTISGNFSIEKPNDILPAGNGTIKVIFTASDGKTDSKSFSIKVTKKSLVRGMISITGTYIYTGSTITPVYYISDSALIKTADYTVTITSNTNAGIATITITATTGGNYTGSASHSFTISKAKPTGDPTYTVITSTGKTLADAKLTVPSGGFKNPITTSLTVPGKLTWDSGDNQKVTAKTAYKWTFTPNDISNYTTVTGSITPYATGITGTDADNDMDDRTFIDVAKSAWYEPAVMYVYEKDLMRSTSTSKMVFSPNNPLTRAMIVTILHRYEDKPDVSTLTNPFSDVPEGTWYTDAVKWAAENGVVKGHPDGSFAPNDNITRQDLAVILVRYAEIKGIEMLTPRTYQNFNDDESIQEYAKSAVVRCYEAEIINGKGNNIFDPLGNATRAEAATMLQRFFEVYGT